MPVSMTHADLPLLMRSLRQGAGLRQQQFANLLRDFVDEKPDSVTRWFVNRIENGHTEVTPELAESLDALAEHLRTVSDYSTLLIKHEVPEFSFSSLVAEQRAHAIEGEGGVTIAKLVSEPGLQQLYVVLCDMRDIAANIALGIHAGKVPRFRVVVVRPKEERLKELFDVAPKQLERDVLGGDKREPLYGGYRERLLRHLDLEVGRLQRLADYEKIDLSIYFSAGVLNPAVIAIRGPDKSACLYWPCRPEREDVIAEEFALMKGGTDIANWYRRFVDRMIQTDFSEMHHHGDVILMSEELGEDQSGVGTDDLGEAEGSDPLRPKLEPVRSAKFSNVFSRATPETHMKRMSAREAMAISMIWVSCKRIRHGDFVKSYLLEQTEKVLERTDENDKRRDEKIVKLSLLNAHVSAHHLYQSLSDRVKVKGESLRALSEVLKKATDKDHHLTQDVSSQTRDLIDWFQYMSEKQHDDVIHEALEDSFFRAAVEELSTTYGMERKVVEKALRLEESDGYSWALLTRESGTRLLTRAFSIELQEEEVDNIQARERHKEGANLAEVSDSDLLNGNLDGRILNSYLRARSEGRDR